MYPLPKNFMFARLGHCLERLHFADEVLPPPRATEPYLVVGGLLRLGDDPDIVPLNY